MGLFPKYNEKCKKLNEIDIYNKISLGFKPVLRFNVPFNKILKFDDLLKGVQLCNSNSIGDFVIRKSNLFPSFIFSNLIDDFCMGVTHIFRGEDHITNTFKQIMLKNSLGILDIFYGHIPMINNFDGQVLSKRMGSFSIKKLKTNGFSSLSMINYLCKFGGGNLVFLSLKKLINFFDYEKIVNRSSKYDISQLLFYQKNYIIKNKKFYKILIFPYVNGIISIYKINFFISIFFDNIYFFNDIIYWVNVFFFKNIIYEKFNLNFFIFSDKLFYLELLYIFNIFYKNYFFYIKNFMNLCFFNEKKLFILLRLFITNKDDGPKLNDIISFLSYEFLIYREINGDYLEFELIYILIEFQMG